MTHLRGIAEGAIAWIVLLAAFLTVLSVVAEWQRPDLPVPLVATIRVDAP